MVNRPRIKPPRIASRNKFLEVDGEDCDPFKCNSRYFSFNEYSFGY